MYTYEELTNKSVHTLRVILRELGGVPRVSDKKQLIDGIVAIQNGENPPTRSPRGRKPIENKFISLEDDFELNELKMSDIPFGERITVKGVVEIVNGKYGFLRGEDCSFNNRNSYILLSTINQFNLKSGDEIDAVSEKMRDSSILTVVEILSINGFLASKPIQRQSFEFLVPRYPTEKYKLNYEKDENLLGDIDLICPIGKGQRTLLTVDGDRYDDVLKRLIKAISKSNPETNVMSLLIGVKPEEIAEYNDLDGCINTSIADCDGSSTNLRKIELFFEKVKRFSECYLDVVVIVNSMNALVKFFAKNQENSESGIFNAKKFFSQSGNYEKGGTVTFIAVLNGEESEIYTELSQVATNEIVLKGCNKRGNAISLDLKKSYTVKDELLLSPEEIKKADNKRESC